MTPGLDLDHCHDTEVPRLDLLELKRSYGEYRKICWSRALRNLFVQWGGGSCLHNDLGGETPEEERASLERRRLGIVDPPDVANGADS
jgi:hypothetical protein